MAENKTREMIKRLENGELDEVLAAALNEANKHKKIGITVADLRKSVLEDLREKEASQKQG
ncbi:MAG: hypothetical protein WC788_06075 [Candidatus Paceibacterota bacterium]|jgi:hypothetical protein